MEYSLNTDLFFEPTKSGFQSISKNGKVVSSKDRKLISNDNVNPAVFLGVRKCMVNHSNPASNSDIFLVTHQQAYILAQTLYELISNIEPTWVYHSNTLSMDWALCLVSSSISIRCIHTSNDEAGNIADYLYCKSEISVLNKFDLIIGVQNGYDNDDEITFYAVIKHKEYDRGNYLTIGSYKFSDGVKLDFINNQYEINILIEDLKNYAAREFKKEIEAFKGLYAHLYEVNWAAIANDFIPVNLDIFNINRSIESIKNDISLQKEIRSRIENCKSFLGMSINRGRNDFAMLLDYVIFNNHFDLMAFQNNRKKTEQIFVQKRTYKTIKQRIMNVIESDRKIVNYTDDQHEIHNKILPYI